jgi:hypothetical protein
MQQEFRERHRGQPLLTLHFLLRTRRDLHRPCITQFFSMLKRLLLVLSLATAAHAAEPDYSAWGAILSKHYDERRGMNYAALKARDLPALQALRARLGKVDARTLTRDQQLAYWINVYNVNVVALVAENYPIESIRKLSTDPLIRLNVFKKKIVPTPGGKISLNDVENERVRAAFRDPRIHFAINCAARSCPPIRPTPFTGANLSAQLDDQVRKFIASGGVRIEPRKGKTVVHTTKIMDWFEDDFKNWGGGALPFLRRYLTAAQQNTLAAAGKNVSIAYDDYNWDLNDRR